MNILFKLNNILIIIILLFGACRNEQNAPPPQTNPTETSAKPAEARRVVLFFGNSLTAAYNLSPEQGFTALIQGKIDSLALPYRCVNAGLSGETTHDGLNRVEWVLREEPAIFVLELGGNDALRGLPVSESVKNMQGIVDKVRSQYPQCKILIAGMLAPPNLGPRYTSAFKAMYGDLAKKNDATLLPFLLEGVAGNPALNLEDGIHPNVKGQRIVAENVWRVLQPML